MTSNSPIVSLFKSSALLATREAELLLHEVEQYPYFVAPRIVMLKSEMRQERSAQFERLLSQTALFTPDRKALFGVLNDVDNRWLALQDSALESQTEEAPMERDDRTLSLIDSFLAAHQDRNPHTAQQQTTTYVPVFDYAALLEEDASDSPEEEQGTSISLIDTFIERLQSEGSLSQSAEELPQQKGKEKAKPLEEKELGVSLIASDDSFLTESLAKIYIKQRRYSKALEIIQKLSLKYPEKNIYFADQIRFLEKLIINTKTK